MFKSLNSHILIFSNFFVNFTGLTHCKEEYKVSKKFGLVTDQPGYFRGASPTDK